MGNIGEIVGNGMRTYSEDMERHVGEWGDDIEVESDFGIWHFVFKKRGLISTQVRSSRDSIESLAFLKHIFNFIPTFS